MLDRSKPTTFLQDAFNAINFALEHHDPSDINTVRRDEILCMCIEFGLTGKVLAPSASCKDDDAAKSEAIAFHSWASLRKHLKQLIAKYHSSVPRQDDPDIEEGEQDTGGDDHPGLHRAFQ